MAVFAMDAAAGPSSWLNGRNGVGATVNDGAGVEGRGVGLRDGEFDGAGDDGTGVGAYDGGTVGSDVGAGTGTSVG